MANMLLFGLHSTRTLRLCDVGAGVGGAAAAAGTADMVACATGEDGARGCVGWAKAAVGSVVIFSLLFLHHCFLSATVATSKPEKGEKHIHPARVA